MPRSAAKQRPSRAGGAADDRQLKLELVLPPSAEELEERAVELKAKLRALHRELRLRRRGVVPRTSGRPKRHGDAQINEAYDKVVADQGREYGAVKETALKLGYSDKTVQRALRRRKADIRKNPALMSVS